MALGGTFNSHPFNSPILAGDSAIVSKSIVGISDIHLSKNIQISNDILLSKTLAIINDILLSKNIQISNDIILKKTIESINDILLSVNMVGTWDIIEAGIVSKSIVGTNDILLNKPIESSNDILLSKTLAIINDILLSVNMIGVWDIIEGGIVSKSIVGTNDILLQKEITSTNDIIIRKNIESINDILLSVNMVGTWDILTYDLVAKILTGTNDILLSKSISSSYDINVEILTYCSTADVYRKAGITSDIISNDDVIEHILDADAEIDELYGKSFYNNQSITEWFDTHDNDIESIESDEINILFLRYMPIQAISSIEAYDRSNTLVKTWSSDEYWLDANLGTLRLIEDRFVNQRHRVKVVYTYGTSSIPRKIQKLSSIISSISILLEQMGGTYDDVTSYSLPTGVSIGVGEPYMNMRTAIGELDKELKRTLDTIGRLKTNSVVI